MNKIDIKNLRSNANVPNAKLELYFNETSHLIFDIANNILYTRLTHADGTVVNTPYKLTRLE